VLPEGYIYPKAERAVRDLLRQRAHLVAQHPSNVRSVQHIMVRNTGSRFAVKPIHELGKPERDSVLAEAEQVLALTSTLVVMEGWRQQIKRLETAVSTRLKPTPVSEQLWTVNGLGAIWAQTIALETGHIGRLASVGDDASYGRGVRSTNVSNGKRQGPGKVKNGHPYLEWAYLEAAQFAIRVNPRVQRFYPRELAQSHLMLARQSVARKLARGCYSIMRDLVPFDVHRAFG
jgi:transposase